VGRFLRLGVRRFHSFFPWLHRLARGFALGGLPGRLVDACGRRFGRTNFGEGTFASGGGGQVTRVSVGQFTVFSGLGGRRCASWGKTIVAWVSIVFNHFHGGKGAGKGSTLLGGVFHRFGSGRSASWRKTIVTWVSSIVFGHRDSRELTGKSSAYGGSLGSVFHRL